MKHYRIQVTGRVQGVYFRAGTLKTALRLGIKGWVKNESDGSVLISAEGDDQQLAKLLQWCHRGPAHASVAQVISNEMEKVGYGTFRVLR